MQAETCLKNPLLSLQQGRCHDPFALLGLQSGDHQHLVRAFMPQAERVELVNIGAMQRIPHTDIFECLLDAEQLQALDRHYELAWEEKRDGTHHQVISPYSFGPLIGDEDLYYFGQGNHHHAYRFLGAHAIAVDGVAGVGFAVWAPSALRVSVAGDFNGWNGLRHLMRSRGESGVWELFVPGLRAGDLYKFEIVGPQGQLTLKADPYARQMSLRPDTACRVVDSEPYDWGDDVWMTRRAHWDWLHEPMSVYEVHPGSWRRNPDGGFMNYRELAGQLVEYVKDLGFTHVELMPVMEHPLDESWGYQVSGYFAPTARYGNPDDLRYLIDTFHRAGIGVILDWVPGHFPKDDFALARFLGEPLYEHADPRRGEHRDWGTLIFDYGRAEVRNFLLANAVYWFEEFHCDGLRVDAVASMLYLDYSREANDWLPNEFGGRENLDAIVFMREMNEVIHARFPGGLTIAEESTDWPMVSRPTSGGGLGFSMKWNMGWMNDTLDYLEHDPVHRRFHHNKLTFSQLYAYSENFVLPLSHDEVVHMKRSLLDKMPGDPWQKFANLRLLLSWQMAHPGKKLLFMGGEIGQWLEWDESTEIDWALLHHETHLGVQALVRDLNHLYRSHDALHRYDCEAQGFEWLECDDSDHSVLAFERIGAEGSLVCLINFTPVARQNYRVPLPGGGGFREIFNSDSSHYGGSNCGNGHLVAEAHPRGGREHSAALTLPPLGMLILKPDSSH